jgi:hypothetical protein
VKSMRRCEGAATFGRKKVQRVPKGYMQALCSVGSRNVRWARQPRIIPRRNLSNKGRIHLRRPTCHLHISLAKQRRTIHCELSTTHPERIEKCKFPFVYTSLWFCAVNPGRLCFEKGDFLNQDVAYGND